MLKQLFRVSVNKCDVFKAKELIRIKRETVLIEQHEIVKEFTVAASTKLTCSIVPCLLLKSLPRLHVIRFIKIITLALRCHIYATSSEKKRRRFKNVTTALFTFLGKLTRRVKDIRIVCTWYKKALLFLEQHHSPTSNNQRVREAK